MPFHPIRPVRHALALCALTSAMAGAQGVVTGQVTILERPGATTTDLGNAVVYLEPSSPPAHLAPTNTSMALQARQFAPRVRVVTVGSRIDFPNQDPFSHNAFSKFAGGFDTEVYRHGQTRSNVFREPGVYPLYCNIHPKMTGFVVAVRTPYFAQADASGRFSIERVPAGKYVIHVWHDRGGEQSSDLTVPPTGLSALTYQLDARGYSYVQHKNKFGQDYKSAGDIY